MEIKDELIQHLANLAKLEIKEDEKDEIREDFKRMLEFVAQLQEVDTTGVEPLIHMTDEINRLRPDVAEETNETAAMLEQAPKPDPAYFRVPKVLNKDE